MIEAELWTGAEKSRSFRMLVLNTLAFTVCFACWMTNGVLMTFLVDNGLQKWSPSDLGWLIGIPVLSGSIFRLPIGVLTDRYGGRVVFGWLMILTAIPMYLLGRCNSYGEFFTASFGFGFAGTAFAVGIAYTSVWFPRHWQGTALGIFGAGNAGAAITSMGAPHLLNHLTGNGDNLEAWRQFPQIYAAVLLVMGVLFLLLTENRIPPGAAAKTIGQQLAPLAHIRVWRFGLYYFFVFGGFVALAQWLIPYYVNAYSMSVAMAGFLAACNSLPSGVIRAIGGFLSDRFGGRAVNIAVFWISLVCCTLLIVPQMEIQSPGSGVMARFSGTVTAVSPEAIVVTGKTGPISYPLIRKQGEIVSDEERRSGVLVFPRSGSWQEAVVKIGDPIVKKQLLARGTTHIFFQANVWIFTFLSFILGAVMGIGKAAVYKLIPDYFPNDVGVVGGIVGVIGGLGGFVCPVIFGYLLQWTGLWTTCWMFFMGVILTCIAWMNFSINRMTQELAPQTLRQFDLPTSNLQGEDA